VLYPDKDAAALWKGKDVGGNDEVVDGTGFRKVMKGRFPHVTYCRQSTPVG
jgi:hypothetical protein